MNSTYIYGGYTYDMYLGTDESSQTLWAVPEAVDRNLEAVKGTYCKTTTGQIYIREGLQWILALTMMKGDKEFVRGPYGTWIPVPNTDREDLFAKIQKLAIQRIARPQDVR